jgi:hypothetical protein
MTLLLEEVPNHAHCRPIDDPRARFVTKSVSGRFVSRIGPRAFLDWGTACPMRVVRQPAGTPENHMYRLGFPRPHREHGPIVTKDSSLARREQTRIGVDRVLTQELPIWVDGTP